jgi:hypothetical protein
MARSSDRKSLQREDGTAPYQSSFPGMVGLIPCVIPCAIFCFFMGDESRTMTLNRKIENLQSIATVKKKPET